MFQHRPSAAPGAGWEVPMEGAVVGPEVLGCRTRHSVLGTFPSIPPRGDAGAHPAAPAKSSPSGAPPVTSGEKIQPKACGLHRGPWGERLLHRGLHHGRLLHRGSPWAAG